MFINGSIRLYRTLGILVGLLTLGGAMPAWAQLGLGLVPMRVELRMGPRAAAHRIAQAEQRIWREDARSR